MNLYNREISHKEYMLRFLTPAKRRKASLENMRIVYHDFVVPGTTQQMPEYIVYLKGKQEKIGFTPGEVRKADNDDPDRIVQFMYDCITGKMPSYSWFYLRSFGHLLRVARGQAAPVKPEQERVFEADKKKVANDYLREEYNQGLAYGEDIERVSKKHDELFKAKIMGEKDRLELLGPDGKSLKTAQDLAQKLEEQ